MKRNEEHPGQPPPRGGGMAVLSGIGGRAASSTPIRVFFLCGCSASDDFVW